MRMASYLATLLEVRKPNVMACYSISLSGLMSTIPTPTPFVLEAPSTNSFQVKSDSSLESSWMVLVQIHLGNSQGLFL